MKSTLSYILFFFSVGLLNVSGQDFSGKYLRAKELIDSLRYDQAIGLLHELLKDAKSVNNDTMIIKIQIKLGSAHLGIDKNEIGIEYYQNALEMAKTLNDLKEVANANYGLGAAYQRMELYDSSEIRYRKAISYFLKSKDEITLSHLYSNLSLLHYKENELDSMRYYSNKALTIQLKIKDRYGAGASYSNLGLIAKDQGRFKDAIKFYKASLNEYDEAEYIYGYSEALRRLGVTYYLMNESDSSSYYFFVYDSIGHDVFHQDYQDKILELETKFKTAEIERDNALKQAEIEENRRQLMILYAFSFLLIIASVATYMFFNQRRKRLKAASDKQIQDLLQNQEMKATYALLEGQDRERKRIAADLHDNLGSILVTLNMYADTLQSKKPEEVPALASKIAEVAHLANEETRKISHSLDSGVLKHFGLEAAIKQLTEAVSSARKITFDLSIQTEKISSEAGLEIYRIIQELVNNTLKHSQCTKVHLELTQVDQSLNIIYEDNGVGFNKQEVSSGMGLRNIENRVQKLDGELTIDSAPGKGSAFIIEISHI
ncbi:Signal transduction histidine kinase [Ekhidna lutea]|uniref:Oxygen sensor histidine kinase NreB n=1 Tax=Ekhidna lutea TaxID=447679 RepID=A0A239KNU8_EKHLU|nr:sensor histidine kinase [Ekhidna lutea]SNT19402.1 Signal transduction histidine kinase [Ekhidna lutea]